MKTKRLPLVLGIFSLLFVSCDFRDPEEQTKTFWVLDDEMKAHEIEAVLGAEGEYCMIWVEKGLEVSDATLSRIASEFDKKIRPALLEFFSIEEPMRDGGKIVAQNSLELADYLCDEDGKMAVFILNMPEEDLSQGSFLAGYFYAGDFAPKEIIPHSNESDIVFMNARLLSDLAGFYKTLAHETQHLINFANSFLRPLGSDGYLQEMDLWINEGLSAAAEYVYSGQHTEERVEWYNAGGTAIPFGNNFFVWGERPQAILDEYATVYLFFQWLRLQSDDGNGIYKRISSSKLLVDQEAVVSALQGRHNYSGDTHLKWETLLKDWLLANSLTSLPSSINVSPKHRYADPLLELKTPWYPNRASTAQLYPGEGVYSFTEDANKPYGSADDGENIKYVAVSRSNGAMNGTTSFERGTLLTYNANAISVDPYRPSSSLLEKGQISEDIPPPTSASMLVDPNKAARLSKPMPISLWDMIRLKEHRKGAPEKPILQKFPKTHFVVEN